MQDNRQKTYVYDIETYPNFFLAVFKEVSEALDSPHVPFTWSDVDKLRQFLSQEGLRLVGYNNYRFDDTIIAAILEGHVQSEDDICRLATEIITSDDFKNRWWPRKGTITWTSIDLMQILGGPKKAGSLKAHQVRLGMADVIDLPIEPNTRLSAEQKREITIYCEHDVDATLAVYFDALPHVEVRNSINARYPYLNGSALWLSDAGIAEAVISEELRTKAAFRRDDLVKPAAFTFDPDERIEQGIRFIGEENQRLLEQLREHQPFATIEWSNGLGKRFRFNVGKHTLTLGSGGLHTLIGPVCVRSPAILEFDVSSYYPNLLRKFERSPAGLPSKWVEIYSDLIDRRVAAKRAGKKSEAEVLKIIINSLYGKLWSESSINFDRNLALQVVLNGQLFLIMLMEQFEAAGIEVIAANTDGIYVNAAEQLERAKEITRKWEQATGFDLESKSCTIYAATGVNNYALYDAAKGWFHRKGRLDVGKRTFPAVIPNVILEHIVTQREIGALISETTDVRDFLYSYSSKSGVVRQGDTRLQKTNRWYSGTNGARLEVSSARKAEAANAKKVPSSDGAIIANSLSSFSLPADLDLDFYAAEATALARDILEGTGEQVKAPKTIVDQAIAAQKRFDFVVVPKGQYGREKANVRETFAPHTIEYWRTTPLNDAAWGAFEGFGAYTGQSFGVVAIDIDDPEKAQKSGLFEVIGERGVAVWHGKRTAGEVRAGKSRGTIVFKYTGDALRTTGGKFLTDYGFEILYGGKVVHLGGFHPTRERYHFAGKLDPLPTDLLNKLEWMVPELATADAADAAIPDEGGLIDKLTAFQTIANADQEYLAVSGALSFHTASKLGVHLRGICIGHTQHTNKGDNQNMIVRFPGGRLNVHCLHESCARTVRKWQTKIEQQLIVPEARSVPQEHIIIEERGRKVFDALQDPARSKLILAPTGTGKTHGIVNLIAPLLDLNSGNDDKFAIICASKDQMQQIAERFATVLATNNINEFGIDLIEAQEAISIGDARSQSSVRPDDGTRVAITHFTYVSRRGFGNYYYAFLRFIDENTHVFVDEVDAFIQSQAFHQPLGSRWKATSRGGQTKNEMVTKCGLFHHFNNCLNCVMRPYNGYKMSLDRFRNPTYEPIREFMEGEKYPKLRHINLDPITLKTIVAGSAEVRILRQADDEGEMVFEDPNDDEQRESVQFEDVFYDHLKCAYLPTVHRALISYEGSEITREDVIARYKSGDRSLSIPPEEHRKLKFPSRACNVLTVTGIDRRPLRRMAGAKSFTGLSATLTPLQKRFIGDMLGDLKVFPIEPDDERRMDKIIVVGMPFRIPADMIANNSWKFAGKMLRFRETASKAEADFCVLERSGIPTKKGKSKHRFLVNEEHDVDHRILLTYSLSSLGRGVDMAPYDIVDVNASIYKPSCVYPTADPASLREQINYDRMNTIAQNVGRILRRADPKGRAEKVIVVEELEGEDEVAALVGVLQQMSIAPIESWWVPDFLEKEESCEWLTKICEGMTLPTDVPRDTSQLLARAAQLVADGCGKKELKLKLRWATIRKRLERSEVDRIEREMDQILANNPHARKERLASAEKVQRQREKRITKIRQLIAKGFSDAKIRSDMKVADTKQGWPEDERAWFAEVLATERRRPEARDRHETSPPVTERS